MTVNDVGCGHGAPVVTVTVVYHSVLAAESVPFRGPNVDFPAVRWHG